MGHAYTPGLKVSAAAEARRTRLLPIAGEVLVAVGDRVGVAHGGGGARIVLP